ncbi:MAG: DUF4173 domain-containing protein [Pseudobutyrivibrio sp.]|nr:DUF4173 domain-containing protein [Pseudobutyrivibrio sp.]
MDYLVNEVSEVNVVNKVNEVNVANEISQDKRNGAKTFKKYGLISLIYGIIYSFCLYDNHSGITYPFYMLATIICLGLVRKKDGLSLIKDSSGKSALGIFYVLSLMLLAIHRCLTTSFAIIFWEGLATNLLLFSFIVYLYVDTREFEIAAWFKSLFLTLVKPIIHIARPIKDFIDYKNEMAKGDNQERRKTIIAVICGIAIAIPLVVVIVALLSSADLVFSRMLTDILEKINLPDNFWDIIWASVTAIVAIWFAYIIPDSLNTEGVNAGASNSKKGNPVIAITFTSIIGVVYIVFSMIQVLYLFTGSIELPKGYTYADYAHEGFYQLLAVCIINLIMVSLCKSLFRESKILKFILATIGVLTYILIASSATRMFLYIGVYHLTFLRLFVLWVLAVLCIWLAFLIISLYLDKFPVFKAGMVAVTIAFIAFVYSNPDYQIAKYDLEVAAEQIDDYTSVESYIIYHLSTDAVPALTSDATLLDRYEDHAVYKFVDEDYTGIRKYNFSYGRAKKVFAQAKN